MANGQVLKGRRRIISAPEIEGTVNQVKFYFRRKTKTVNLSQQPPKRVTHLASRFLL
jgi:hypothetical protein